MPSLDQQLMQLSLRQLGELVEVQVEASVEDRRDFERFLDVPLSVLAREFRSPKAFRRFVVRKLEQAEDRARTLRIAAIFSDHNSPLGVINPMTTETNTRQPPAPEAGEPLAACGEPTAAAESKPETESETTEQ